MPSSPISVYRASRCNYMYVCQIAADGTFTLGPEFWTVTKTALGTYKITHGLGHLHYSILPMIAAGGTYQQIPVVVASDATSVTISIYNTGALADLPFQLSILSTQQ